MKTILIAVQDEGLAMLLSEELMEEAYDVTVCSDAVSLIRDVRMASPDLVLMDEQFGGGQKTILHRNICTCLKDTSLILLWRGNRPNSLPRADVEGFALSGLSLSALKRRIEGILEEGFHTRVAESHFPFSAPLVQTEFRWLKAD